MFLIITLFIIISQHFQFSAHFRFTSVNSDFKQALLCVSRFTFGLLAISQRFLDVFPLLINDRRQLGVYHISILTGN